MNEDKNKGGRPTDYTLELGEEICDVISCTNKGLQRLCRENSHWPDHATIYRWIRKHSEFRDNYAEAKEFQAEIGVDEIIDIADDGALDYVVNDKGQVIADKEHIQRSRLRVDTRKWAASKRLAKKYGDRIQTEISGQNGAPIEYADLTDAQRKLRAAELFDKARARRAAVYSGNRGEGSEEMETSAGSAD